LGGLCILALVAPRDPLEQGRWTHTKRASNPDYVFKVNISLTALDTPNISRMKICLVS